VRRPAPRARFHGKRRDLPRLPFVENLEIALLQPAHCTTLRVAHHYLQLHKLRLHSQVELRRCVSLRASVDLVRLGCGEERACHKRHSHLIIVEYSPPQNFRAASVGADHSLTVVAQKAVADSTPLAEPRA